jgi:acetyl esterase/lipase
MKHLFFFLLTALSAHAFSYPPVIEGAKVEVYRTVGDTELKAWIFESEPSDNPKPAIVFFFGGGWTQGSPAQFEKQCRYFADRGMVAITVDYRVKSRHQVKPIECVKDAKAALAWVREHAERLGIDPTRIAAAGASAGGHLAAATGTLTGYGSNERPNAMILFNPVLVLAPPLNGKVLEGVSFTNFHEKRLGAQPEDFSPAHHIGAHTPPTLILHGTSDTTVAYINSEAFTEAMTDAERSCKLVGYEGKHHGFFNKSPNYENTLEEADNFLTALGWLDELKR